MSVDKNVSTGVIHIRLYIMLSQFTIKHPVYVHKLCVISQQTNRSMRILKNCLYPQKAVLCKNGFVAILYSKGRLCFHSITIGENNFTITDTVCTIVLYEED